MLFGDVSGDETSASTKSVVRKLHPVRGHSGIGWEGEYIEYSRY